jgi:hypothetical protein
MSLQGKKYEKNARRITAEAKANLQKWMSEYGDLSGVILNKRNGQYVGGNQRSDVLGDGELVIEAQFEVPDNVGTLAYGYVIYQGQRFTYREVDWEDDKHRRASLIANNNVGKWADDILKNEFADVLQDTGFDAERIEEILQAGEDVDQEPENLDKPIYPIVPKFTEKHSAFVIICDNEVDENSLKEILGVQTKQSYKNQNTGSSHIITALEFFNAWNKSQS